MTVDQSPVKISDERELLIDSNQNELHPFVDTLGDPIENDDPLYGKRIHKQVGQSLFSKALAFMSSGSLAGSSRLPHGHLRQADWIYKNPPDQPTRSFYNQLISSSNDQDDPTKLKCINRKPTYSFPLSRANRRFRCCSLFAIFVFLMVALTCITLVSRLFSLVSQAKVNSDNDQLELARILEGFHENSNAASLSARWVVSSSKCHIPNLDRWHQSIKEYVKVKPALNCMEIFRKYSNGSESLTYVKDNRLYFTQDAIISDCCYREIKRGTDNDDDLETSATCNSIKTNGLVAPAQLIKLECKLHNYTNIHSFVIHDDIEESTLKRRAEAVLDQDEFYNVVMVGMDTISRLNGYRQLESTLKYLKEAYETIEFVGYNKVGENTFPNLIPFLSGLKPEQLTKTMCWLATNYTDDSEKGDDYLDNCKYLWNFYQQLGYITYFSEDWPKASTFNYLKPGFKREPTNFYGRPFTLARDDYVFPPKRMGCSSCLLDKPLVQVDLENLKSFISTYDKSLPYFAFQWINCPQHDDLNGASQVDSIVEKFFKDIHDMTHNNRTFVIFFSDHGYRWNDFVSTRIGHYESSLPLMTIAAPKVFIEKHPTKYKNMISHRSSLLTPFDLFKSFVDLRDLGLKKEPVKTRAVRAPVSTESPDVDTTEYMDNNSDNKIVKQEKILDGLTYKQEFTTLSIFDFHNKTQLDRSCIEAGIPDNYCVCDQFQDVSTTSVDVIGAAYYLVYIHMDGRIMKNADICYPLELESIKKAEFFDFEQSKANQKVTRREKRSVIVESTIPPLRDNVLESRDNHTLPNREYNILLATKPGGGLFQEVVRYYGSNLKACIDDIKNTKLIIDDNSISFSKKHERIIKMNEVCKFSVHSESIMRLNLYKDQSKCVRSDIELKKICYCKDLRT